MVCFLLVMKSHVIHKRRWSIVTFVVAVILTIISSLIPMENAFVTFSSPQSAYNYNHSGNVKLIVHGNNTDFVVGANGDADVYTIVPKSDGGWKIGMGLDTKRIVHTISDGISIYVYQYKSSDDYYITVLDTNGGPSEVADNHNSIFQCLDKSNSTMNKSFYTYFTYINGYDNQYALTINGKTIKIQN